MTSEPSFGGVLGLEYGFFDLVKSWKVGKLKRGKVVKLKSYGDVNFS